VAVHSVEARFDQNDLKMKPGFIQCNNAWLTGELEEDLDSSGDVLVFGSMRVGNPSNVPDLMR
jgi:hypothetical protein